MRVAVFSTHGFERPFLERANNGKHTLQLFEQRLTLATAPLATGYSGISVFANDCVDNSVIRLLREKGVSFIAIRAAGFNNVDLLAAKQAGIRVARVPAYSPHAVAEHAVALLLALNRKVHRAHNRVREGNFSLDGLVGFDLFGKTVGVVGTGKIGSVFAMIMKGFGCQVLAHDTNPNYDLAARIGFRYASLEEVYATSQVISLHLPLSPSSRHLIDASAFAQMIPGALLINTSRGAIIETKALIAALKLGQLGGAGLDVYEEEENYFFADLSCQVLQDDVLARLLTFPNVLITAHQGFLTQEALRAIADTTIENISAFEQHFSSKNEIAAA